MPVYGFTCEACGPFEVRRPAADAGAAAACPACRGAARRLYTPPGLTVTPAPLRDARNREEKSAHQPEVVSAPSGRPLPWAHRH